MTARHGVRFALALLVAAALIQLTLSGIITTGLRGGPAGVLLALTLGGFAIGIAFTAVYDGPRRLWRLVSRRPVPTSRP